MSDATLVLTRTYTAALTRLGLNSRSSSVEGFPPITESTRFKRKEEGINSNALDVKSMICVEGIRYGPTLYHGILTLTCIIFLSHTE